MAELNVPIIAKASATAGEVPQASDLEVAELSLNTADGKLFTKHTDNSVKEIGGSGGGGGSVDSVNSQTGVVSLGVQDMDDFELDGGSPLADGDILQWVDADSKFKPSQLPGRGAVTSWSVTANGTSDYIFAGDGFTGAETDPTLYVVRGQTYTITNSMGAHPFQIQSTAGAGGTVYNNGITNNTVSNGTLTWEVRLDAPAKLYYQCTAHANMGGTIQVLENVDPSASNLRSLLGFGEYIDDTTAGAAGLTSGAIYFNTTSSDYRAKA